jgi:O-antigen ligase
MPMSPVKKRIRRLLIRLSPLAAIYVAVGWTMPSGIFKPIATLQSVTRPATDVSTMTRDIENYDITMTINDHPVLGLGWGHGYYQIIPLPPMPHPLEPWLPHNSLLGLWFASGVVGYTAMTLLWTAGVYFGVRAYRAASRPIDRAVLLPCFGSVLMYMIQCYGDVGIGSWTAVFTVAPALAVSGKLAVLSGAWPVGKPRAASTESASSASPAEQHPGHAGSS